MICFTFVKWYPEFENDRQDYLKSCFVYRDLQWK